MKTYEEFRLMVMEFDFPLPVSHAKIEELAAKEYAKQWINHASDIAAFDCQDMLTSQRIKELTKIIDKQ